MLLLVAAAAVGDTFELAIDEVVVTGARTAESLFDFPGSIARLDGDDMQLAQHHHIHELLTRVSGVWLSRGSGQEHLTAIRSPVLTGAGSCGAFLTLEDGIPTRPSGFCNVNQMFELNTEQAESIEVIRGPGNALYGSNALHGTINVLMPAPGDGSSRGAAIELGANDFLRLRGTMPFSADSNVIASIVVADDGGFRDDSGHRQGKGNFKFRSPVLGGRFVGGLSLSTLRQETAGFILGQDAYKDPNVNRTNPNPEAFRDADSARLYGIWNRDAAGISLDIRPFVRTSEMEFLQHFLPGQPLEENGQTSAGVLSALTFANDAYSLIVGLDIEWADVFLKETQFGPTEGSAFLQETRPEGKHYDFDVTSWGAAPYLQLNYSFSRRFTLAAGLRAEWMHYDYVNRMLDGNTRDDGTICGFGGCLYTRPADRSDTFSNLAPKLGATWVVHDKLNLYANVARGFRAPQMTELYRLQNGQQIADLKSETIDSADIGLRAAGDRIDLDVSVFAMRKRESVYRDASGFNVSGGRSVHHGVETRIDWLPVDAWQMSLVASYARHRYDFNTIAARGETFVSGRDVDTAPKFLGNLDVKYRPTDRLMIAGQWAAIGAYFLDAENRFTYPGHDIVNVKAEFIFGEHYIISGRVNNIADRAIADRADYAFGQYRYFPGRGRELFVQLTYRALN